MFQLVRDKDSCIGCTLLNLEILEDIYIQPLHIVTAYFSDCDKDFKITRDLDQD